MSLKPTIFKLNFKPLIVTHIYVVKRTRFAHGCTSKFSNFFGSIEFYT